MGLSGRLPRLYCQGKMLSVILCGVLRVRWERSFMRVRRRLFRIAQRRFQLRDPSSQTLNQRRLLGKQGILLGVGQAVARRNTHGIVDSYSESQRKPLFANPVSYEQGVGHAGGSVQPGCGKAPGRRYGPRHDGSMARRALRKPKAR